MSIGKAILSGLAGAARGGAKLALLEDEERRDMTKQVYATGVTMAEKYGEMREASNKEIREENEKVKALQNTVVNGQPLGSANARAIVRKANALGIKNPLEVLAQYEISGEATVEVQTPKTKRAVPEGLDLEEGGGFFSKGRTESAVSDAEKLLRGSGIDLEYKIPQRPIINSSELTFTKREEEEFTTTVNKAYLYQGDANPIGLQVITYYDKKNPNKPPVTVHQDMRGRTIEVDPTDPNTRILSSLEKGDGTDIGPILVGTKDGYVPYKVDGVPQIGIQDGNIIYEQNPDGSKGNIVKNATILGSMDTRSGQDVTDLVKNSKIPAFKTFDEQFKELVALQEQANTLDERIGYMMEKNQQIGDAGYSAGGMLTVALNSGIKAVSSTAAFLDDLATSDRFQGTGAEAEEARFTYVEQQESVLRDLVSAGDYITEGLNEVETRAIRMQQLQAESILLAYDLAKATGDTRISNQDFDAFMKTVKGNSVKTTHALLKRSGERVLSRFESKYASVTKTSLPAAKAGVEGEDVSAGTTATLNLYTEQLAEGGRFDPEILKTQFKRTAEKFSPEPEIPEAPKAGTDFDTEKVELDDGRTVLRVTFKDGGFIDLGPRYLDVSKEEVAEALVKIRQAQGQ